MARGIWKLSTRALESLKIGTLMGFFYPKKKMYDLKIYRGFICHNSEELCKTRRGIDLLFQNWQENFDKFWSEHSKISKMCTSVGSFWSKLVMLVLEKYRGFMFDGFEDWSKGKLTCALKNDMKNLTHFRSKAEK